MKHILNVGMSALILMLIFNYKSNATQDFAIRYNQISCTSCHFNPVGGGPLKRSGKLFQTSQFKTTPLDLQNYISADLIGLAFIPENPKTSKGGLGLMGGSMAVHIPLTDRKNSFLVIENNIAGFALAPLRDTYVLYNFYKEAEYKLFESLLIGRFRSPFGLVSNEHRTYTRLQTGTRWFDFETGILLSGTPNSKIHYDLALVNGKNFSGEGLNTGQANEWGSIFNIRIMPSFFLLGSSVSYYKSNPAEISHSWSIYSVISLARLNYNLVPATLKLEYAESKGFNSILNQGDASDPNYVNSIVNSKSQGLLVRLDWLLTTKFTLIYKYDWLTPDADYPIDNYQRHGLGFRWNISPFTYLSFRSEIAKATHPSEKSKSGQLAQNANFLILEASF